MFDLHISNTGQRTKMPLEICQGSSLDLTLPSSRCKPYFFELETSTFYHQSEPAAFYAWVTGLRLPQALQWDINVNFLLWMFSSWLMVSSFLKMVLFVSQSLIMDFFGFFSTQMKWRHSCCAQHVPSSVSALSCSVFLSEGYCSQCQSPEVPREGKVVRKSCIKCQSKICSSNRKWLKGNIPRLLLLPKPIWLCFNNLPRHPLTF